MKTKNKYHDGLTHEERFDALCDLIQKALSVDEIVNNKYGVNAFTYLAAKLGVTHKAIHVLNNRKNTENRYASSNVPMRVVQSALRELSYVGLPPSMQKLNTPFYTCPDSVDENGNPTANGYYARRRGITDNSTINKKPRATISCATTDEIADKILALTLACGLPKTSYMRMCIGIFAEAVEMTIVTGSNPALTMHDKLGSNRPRVPFFDFISVGSVKQNLRDKVVRDRALYIMNNTPLAYQSDIAIRLTKWWFEMQIDGTLPAARHAKIIKYRSLATDSLSKLSPETIKEIIMEKKPRSQSALPSIGELRVTVKPYNYEIEKNKDGAGYVLVGNGFKLSGLTAREVYIAVLAIKQERKLVNIIHATEEASKRANLKAEISKKESASNKEKPTEAQPA